MNGKNLLEGLSPVTQSAEAGKALAKFLGLSPSMVQTLEEHDRNLHKMPKSYQRMVRTAREEAESEPLELIHKGGFRPCLPEEAV